MTNKELINYYLKRIDNSNNDIDVLKEIYRLYLKIKINDYDKNNNTIENRLVIAKIKYGLQEFVLICIEDKKICSKIYTKQEALLKFYFGHRDCYYFGGEDYHTHLFNNNKQHLNDFIDEWIDAVLSGNFDDKASKLYI